MVTQSFIMNSHEVFIHIHQGCFAGTGAIVRLPQCQWSKPDGYGKISQCITTTKHSKAKTVCIFLGIYCIHPTILCDTPGYSLQINMKSFVTTLTSGVPQCHILGRSFSNLRYLERYLELKQALQMYITCWRHKFLHYYKIHTSNWYSRCWGVIK